MKMYHAAQVAFLGTKLASFFTNTRAEAAISSSGCLCTSDQSCWPSADIFSQLESQLSQPLVYPVPSASPCYPPSHPSGNCTDVIVNWNRAGWRAGYPGAMDSINFEAYIFPNGTVDGCFLDTGTTGTCGQGRVPVVGVDARSVEDIQTAVGFAVEHGLKLVVRNTGHDGVGRSAARGSFMVWTHNMKNITYDAAFVPQGAPENETYQAMTLGAGVEFQDAYAAAAYEYGRIIVGGASSSVGAAGGWLMGGGYSAWSPTYGLGVDNALEISVVLSTGEYLTTNEYQYADLFWALRGGGGGTYGIVTSVTYRTYPTVPVQEWIYLANVLNASVLPELIEGFFRYQPGFVDDGWGGYIQLAANGMDFLFFGLNMTDEAATTSQQGWEDFVLSLAPYGVVPVSTTTYYPSWYDPYYAFLLLYGLDDSANQIVTSRLLSQETLAANSSQVAQLLIDCEGEINMVAGGRVSQLSADSVGVNPAWRNAVVSPLCTFAWNDSASSTEVEQVIQRAKDWVQAMYDVSPNDGTYFNDASPWEIDWQTALFGSHYSTLKTIKDKYDPYRLFVVHQGVGSDDWNEDLTCRN